MFSTLAFCLCAASLRTPRRACITEELESVIYVVRGQARMRWGARLQFVAEAGPGDSIFVPLETYSCVQTTRRWSSTSPMSSQSRSRKRSTGSIRSIDGREIDTSSGFITRHRNPNRFIRRAEHRLLDHAIDRLPAADALECELTQELRPHAARAHKFRREQGRALEILAQRFDARS